MTSSSEGPLYLSSSAAAACARTTKVTNITITAILFMSPISQYYIRVKTQLLKYIQHILTLIFSQWLQIARKGEFYQLLNQIEYIIYILPQMQIFLHHIDGSQSVVQIEKEATLESLLANFNASSCRAVYQGMHVTSLLSLEDNANVYLTADLDGGKKKKKKKVFTTKKKNKHIHKRVKLAVYSLYSVDGKGAVTQQRKTCPSCGPGTFMAQHWDRYYCGFCHTTIKMDAETIKKNEQIMKKKKAALQAQKKAKEKEAADKAPAGKGKKDAKKAAAKKK